MCYESQWSSKNCPVSSDLKPTIIKIYKILSHNLNEISFYSNKFIYMNDAFLLNSIILCVIFIAHTGAGGSMLDFICLAKRNFKIWQRYRQ